MTTPTAPMEIEFPNGQCDRCGKPIEKCFVGGCSPVSGGEEGELLADIEASKARAMASADGKIILSSQTYCDLLDLATREKREKVEDLSLRDLANTDPHKSEMMQAITRVIEMAIVRHGVEEYELLGTIGDAQKIVSLLLQPTEASGSLKEGNRG